jgi:hypothetical protein
VDAPVVGHRLQQPLDGDLEPHGVAVHEQVVEELVAGLLVERLQRVGVSGVAGLGALGLRHAQLVEQHDLQLLGRTEVDLLADHDVGVLRRLLHLRGELRLQRGQRLAVDGDTGGLQVGEHVLQRQLQLGEQLGAAALGQVGVQRIGQLGHRGRGDHLGVRPRRVGLLLAPQEGQLAVLGLAVGAQLAAQVAQREVGEVEAALSRPGQVCRESGVAGEPGERPAPPTQGV